MNTYSNNFKIAVAQMKVTPSNVAENLARILQYINDAKKKGAELIVFPELCVPGYLLGDRWEYDAFIHEIERANEAIKNTSHGVVVIWGSVIADWDKLGEDGRVRKYNAACIATNGEWVSNGELNGFVPKTNLPKYRIFDDARHFYGAAKLASERGLELGDILCPFSVTLGGVVRKIAITVCEDLWEDEYNTKPSVVYARQEPDFLIDISQSPWTEGKWGARDTMLRKRSTDASVPILYVNNVGLQNNTKNIVWFDGGSSCINHEGTFVWRAPQHIGGLFELTWNEIVTSLVKDVPVDQVKGVKEIHDAIIHAMKEFFSPFPKIVIGLSGGIDSALALALLVESVGAEKILAINMPTRFNSMTTQDLAKKCAENFGTEYKVVPIETLYTEQLNTLTTSLGYDMVTMPSVVKENIQARIRGQQLASIAACEKGVFTNNGNKTEVALNYFTLYGDAAGAVAFLADLWKGQVYEMATYINIQAGDDIIPQGIIDIIPSAELSADQNVDEGKGDPIFYEYHDQLLRMFIERRWDITTALESIIAGTLEEKLGCANGTIKKYFPTKQAFIDNLEWAWKNYNIEFKRVQLPPVFLTSRRAFGFDRRDTIAPAFFSQSYITLKETYLSLSDSAT